MSYKPALLPQYRRKKHDVDEGCLSFGEEYYLPARTFCNWHRMVFLGPTHPTIQQASKLRKHYNNGDLRKMFRISRLELDEVVFAGNYQWTPRYRSMWKRWLEERSPDFAVVFSR